MVTYEFDINILSFADDFQVYRLVAIDHERIRLSSYKMNKKKKVCPSRVGPNCSDMIYICINDRKKLGQVNYWK